MRIDTFSPFMKLVETAPSLNRLGHIKKIVVAASVPEGLPRTQRAETLRKVTLFSEKLHKIVGVEKSKCLKDIDLAITRLQNELQSDLIDLLWYVKTAAQIAQIAIPLLFYHSAN